jgi:hypothetical protein
LEALPYVASEVDYLVCIAPSRSDNRKMVNAEIFSRMSDIYVRQAVEIFWENLRRYLRGETKDLLNRVQ